MVRGEPQAVVDEVRVLLPQQILGAQLVLRQRELLERLVRGVQRPRRRRLVDLARLDADETVLHEVRPPHAVLAGPLVQRLRERHAVHLVAIEADRASVRESDLDFSRGVRRVLRRPRPGIDLFGRRRPRISKDARFDAASPEVLVGAVRARFRRRHGHAALRRPLDLFFAAHPVLAHRRDDLQVRRERLRADIEPDLVVAFAGAAVRRWPMPPPRARHRRASWR